MNSPKKRLRTKSFNVLFTPDEHSRLVAAAEACSQSAGQFIRDAVTAKMAMDWDHRPTCASGMPCLIPHVHPPRPGAGAASPAAPPVAGPYERPALSCVHTIAPGVPCAGPADARDPVTGLYFCRAHAHHMNPAPAPPAP